jgi:murein DD-endopeptidase MepM/ murein hydrolase activator NlpD
MTSRRRYPLPAIARTLPKAARGGAAVLGVTGFVLTLIATAGHPGGVRAVAAERNANFGSPLTTATTQQPDTSQALGLFGLAEAEAITKSAPAAKPQPARVTRSHARAPLHHRWVRPQYGPLTSGFGYRWGRLHAGIDLAGPYGSLIVAATDGCITYAGPESGYGEVMRITDWDGTQTVYGHMSAFLRRSGCVHAGTPIARVGSGGDATGPHLHFEVRIGGVPVDPIRFLAKRGVHI